VNHQQTKEERERISYRSRVVQKWRREKVKTIKPKIIKEKR